MGILNGEEISKKVRYLIDYEKIEENNFQSNVQEALKFYLNNKDNISGDDSNSDDVRIEGFLLCPQALNPFLKIVESLNEVDRFLILPQRYYGSEFDTTGWTEYIVIWTGKKCFPVEIITKSV